MYQLLDANSFNILDKLNGFIDFLKNLEIGIYDIIDVVLLTVMFALFLTFARRKMVSSAIIGMGVFYLFFAVASLLPLPGTSMIASAMLHVGVVAFIILFHTEIRDLFEKIGSNPRLKLFKSGVAGKLNYQIIDNVCSAVRELSATKTGALIVIARTTQLDDVTSTGVSINADVNSYLLRNLFFNKAPLHDGAIVIDEGRIISAGCILPLTRRNEFDGDLGTRHKAAIGLSEVSDAIIIVVSEETGTISVAMDYTLTRDYTPDTLRKFLVTNILQDSDIE
jgi:diadenylate cyclase